MFTGLVEGQGLVKSLVPEGEAIRLDIELPADFAGLAIGDSVAINGCCLTVIELADLVAAFQAGAETLSKTNLGRVRVGHRVNLERSLRADGRFGGHIVQGHVDGVGEVLEIARDGEWVTMWFRIPTHLAKYLVPKGSVTVDGISLTVVNAEPDKFSVALIPHTLDVTTLGVRTVGDVVNIETDILGKYVERLLSARLKGTTN
jgi:riboflavin synthase